MCSVAAASMAPVLPADMTAWASPAATSLQATTSDDSGLARTALAPSSSEPTLSGA